MEVCLALVLFIFFCLSLSFSLSTLTHALFLSFSIHVLGSSQQSQELFGLIRSRRYRGSFATKNVVPLLRDSSRPDPIFSLFLRLKKKFQPKTFLKIFKTNDISISKIVSIKQRPEIIFPFESIRATFSSEPFFGVSQILNLQMPQLRFHLVNSIALCITCFSS